MKGLDKVHDGDVEAVLEEVVAARRVGTDPKDLFGGPRDWIDAGAPTVVFVVANIFASLDAALKAAIVAEIVIIAVRLVRRETLRHAFSGAFGVAIAVFFAKRLGGGRYYFLPGLITNGAYGLAFVVSVLARHPLVGVVMRLVQDKPKEWHEHPVVRRAYTEATLLWAGMFLLRVAIMGTLFLLDQTTWLGIAKIALGYPLYIGVLALTLPYVKRRTGGVVLPASEPGEAEAESSGDDARADAP